MVSTLDEGLRNLSMNILRPKEATDEEMRQVEELYRLSFLRQQKNLIDRFADDHDGIAKVVRGDTSFSELGRQIIYRSLELEQIAQDSKIKRVRRDDIIGKDTRDPDDVREITQYLTDQRIIDPKIYFKSRTVINAFPKLGKMVSRVYDVANNYRGGYSLSALGLSMLTGIACAKYVIGLEAVESIPAGFMIGVIPYFASTFGLCSLDTVFNEDMNGLTKQRQKFETTLRKMDDTISQFYPPIPSIKIVPEQIA